MTEHDDHRRIRLIVFRSKRASKERTRAKHVEVRAGDHRAGERDRLSAIDGHRAAPGCGADERDLFERTHARAQLAGVIVRELAYSAVLSRPHDDDAVGRIDAERRKQHGLNDAEHRRAGPDADRERPDRGGGEAWFPAQASQSILHVPSDSSRPKDGFRFADGRGVHAGTR